MQYSDAGDGLRGLEGLGRARSITELEVEGTERVAQDRAWAPPPTYRGRLPPALTRPRPPARPSPPAPRRRSRRGGGEPLRWPTHPARARPG